MHLVKGFTTKTFGARRAEVVVMTWATGRQACVAGAGTVYVVEEALHGAKWRGEACRGLKRGLFNCAVHGES